MHTFWEGSVITIKQIIIHIYFYIYIYMSWPENQGILFFLYFSNIPSEPDIFHGFTH